MKHPSNEALWQRFRNVRQRSLTLTSRLSAEDQCVQSMPDASPVKWHLAHTTWFFETLVLQAHDAGYRVHHPGYAQLFNSYYESLGPRHPRPQRGLLTRPSLSEVLVYRLAVEEAVERLLMQLPGESAEASAARALVELGLNHEEQHQELICTDALHLMSLNPLSPAVCPGEPAWNPTPPNGWMSHGGGMVEIGHSGSAFAFDNEGPVHRAWLEPFAIAQDLVTNGDYQQFVDDGGYRNARWWLSEGWQAVQSQGWQAPLHWRGEGEEFTLHGIQPRKADQAVRHVSYFEAAAYAEWAGERLPTEFEWETAVRGLHPPAQAHGSVWQWTRSAYSPYPRFRPAHGAVGEYNGKFMVGQMVLRGSSVATPAGHSRSTYRNFFPPSARWQFSGIRLARDL